MYEEEFNPYQPCAGLTFLFNEKLYDEMSLFCHFHVYPGLQYVAMCLWEVKRYTAFHFMSFVCHLSILLLALYITLLCVCCHLSLCYPTQLCLSLSSVLKEMMCDFFLRPLGFVLFRVKKIYSFDVLYH